MSFTYFTGLVITAVTTGYMTDIRVGFLVIGLGFIFSALLRYLNGNGKTL